MYVDALYIRDFDIIRVVERRNGERHLIDYPVDYSFYINDNTGDHESIFKEKLKKIAPKSYKDYVKAKSLYSHKKLYESDVNYVFRCLEQNYMGQESPDLHIAFFDIETDFDNENGYSTPEDASNPITSIAVYLQWMEQMVCLAVPPKTLTLQEAQDIADEVGDTIIFQTEAEMLDTFMTLVEDADVLSGWNSEQYDIPYTVNRITKTLCKAETRRLCLWDQLPRRRYIRLGAGKGGRGKKVQTYDLFGRVHSDYLQLYKKYAYEERHSYALDSIAEVELGERKVPYDGTLDQLYNYDFKKFLEYNIQDTRLLDRLDKKLKYIDLLSSIAHDNNVLMTTALGTVSLVEQAITAEAHSWGMIVPDGVKKASRDQYGVIQDEDDDITSRAAGGWVSQPKKGLHKWVGSADLASLYPSVIRGLNMSPETLVGQVSTEHTERLLTEYINEAKRNTFTEWWNDRFTTVEMDYYIKDDDDRKLEITFEDGSKARLTGHELRKLIFHSRQPWCISANGTIFRTDFDGIIPSLLTRWYEERKVLKGIKAQVATIINGEYKHNLDSDKIKVNKTPCNKTDVYDFRLDMLDGAINTEKTDVIINFLEQWGLHLVDDKIVPQDAWLDLWNKAKAYWDKKQLVKKITLNSAYGGLLNEYMKFYDKRIGQSTTLTGRCITRHMTAKTNELLCGEYDPYGECVLYNDTDSVYFSAWPAVKDDVEKGEVNWTKDLVINLYNNISEEVSKTFPKYVSDTFNINKRRGEIIQAEREIVAKTALFVKKKRYAALVVDKEGERKDINGKEGSIKVTGLDLRRSDTPKYIQEFLMKILSDVLHDKPEEDVILKIRDFKEEFEKMDPWEKGMPKAVNNLTSYQERWEEHIKAKAKGEVKGKFTMPGHVKASLNWNRLREANHDYHVSKIVDGQKVAVCYLKENPDKMTSIAYPVDEPHLPSWFKKLPFDEEEMMTKLIDNKIKNLLRVLKWDLTRASKEAAHFETLFTFK